MMPELVAQPLSTVVFADFGEVIEAVPQARHYPINRGFTERYHDLARVDVTVSGGRPLINIFRSSPLPLPIQISMMERHPRSSQTFMPLGNEPYLVVVAPAGDFAMEQLQAFIAQSDQGVNYHRGTWHHFCLALNKTSDFLVIDRGGNGNNCGEVDLSDNPVSIILPADYP